MNIYKILAWLFISLIMIWTTFSYDLSEREKERWDIVASRIIFLIQSQPEARQQRAMDSIMNQLEDFYERLRNNPRNQALIWHVIDKVRGSNKKQEKLLEQDLFIIDYMNNIIYIEDKKCDNNLEKIWYDAYRDFTNNNIYYVWKDSKTWKVSIYRNCEAVYSLPEKDINLYNNLNFKSNKNDIFYILKSGDKEWIYKNWKLMFWKYYNEIFNYSILESWDIYFSSYTDWYEPFIYKNWEKYMEWYKLYLSLHGDVYYINLWKLYKNNKILDDNIKWYCGYISDQNIVISENWDYYFNCSWNNSHIKYWIYKNGKPTWVWKWMDVRIFKVINWKIRFISWWFEYDHNNQKIENILWEWFWIMDDSFKFYFSKNNSKYNNENVFKLTNLELIKDFRWTYKTEIYKNGTKMNFPKAFLSWRSINVSNWFLKVWFDDMITSMMNDFEVNEY